MIDEENKQKLFKHYPVLSEIGPERLSRALVNATLVTFKAGTLVFEELQSCNAFPFVLSGEIRVFKQSAGGRELSLYTVTSGDACVVTAGCLLGDEPYNALGDVKSDCTLVMMGGGDFNDLLSVAVFREYIFSLFSKRVLNLMQLVEEVAFQKLDRRLASLLLRQDSPIEISHQELADELGTVREMITRLLNGFSDAGVIRLGRGRIEVLDKASLEKTADD